MLGTLGSYLSPLGIRFLRGFVTVAKKQKDTSKWIRKVSREKHILSVLNQFLLLLLIKMDIISFAPILSKLSLL